MKYSNIMNGRFISRQNRFTAQVEIGGKPQAVHVKNTGRLRDLLVPGAEVWLEKSGNPSRKTLYDLVSVRKGERIVNVDSQLPNAAAGEWILSGAFRPDIRLVKREVTYGNSRFDLYVEYEEAGQLRRAFMEVKGVTLEQDGVVRFPDAPTERGIKHIRELELCRCDGYEAYLLFVIQMKGVRFFEPARDIHPEFAGALREAAGNGVCVLARDCEVTPDSMRIRDMVEVRL